MKILVFDTETSGLPKEQKSYPNEYNLSEWPYIVQFSYILYDTDLKQITTLEDNIIKVPCHIKIPEQSVMIHGITNEISQTQGKDISLVLYKFVEQIKQSDIVVAHNITFDTKVIIAEIMRLPEISRSKKQRKLFLLNAFDIKNYYCTMKESINLCKIISYTKSGKQYYKYPTQTELCYHLFGFEPINMHNSLNDIIICLRNFYKMNFNEDICEYCYDIKKRIQQLQPVTV